jgi:hypothetical protein
MPTWSDEGVSLVVKQKPRRHPCGGVTTLQQPRKDGARRLQGHAVDRHQCGGGRSFGAGRRGLVPAGPGHCVHRQRLACTAEARARMSSLPALSVTCAIFKSVRPCGFLLAGPGHCVQHQSLACVAQGAPVNREQRPRGNHNQASKQFLLFCTIRCPVASRMLHPTRFLSRQKEVL